MYNISDRDATFISRDRRTWCIYIRRVLVSWFPWSRLLCLSIWSHPRRNIDSGRPVFLSKNSPGSSSTPSVYKRDNYNLIYNNCNISYVSFLLCSQILHRLTFEKPVVVITLGCTCELQNPSHFVTDTSPLQVLLRRPISSYSSLLMRTSDCRVSQLSSSAISVISASLIAA